MGERGFLIWSAAAAAILTGLAPAPKAEAQAASGPTRASGLEEIVVTARKKEETLLEAPVAVTAFGEAQIAELGLQSIDDIARFTPGMSFSKAFGRSSDRPVVRGQANVLATVQSGVESGTAFFVDGVYYAGDIQSLDLNDLQRVEVIKGPQSALYGRNTYAGAVNFITKAPGDTFNAQGKLSYAEQNEIDASARIAGPILGEMLTGSLAARYYTYDGEWTNAATGELLGGEETTSVSGVLDFQPTSSFRTKARLTYLEDRDGPRAFGFQNSNANNCFPGFRSNAFRGAAATTNNNPNQYFCGVIKDSGVYNQNTGANGTRPGSPFMGVHRDAVYGSVVSEANLPNKWKASALIGFRNESREVGSDSDFQNDNGAFALNAPGTRPAFTGVPASNGLFQLGSRSRFEDYSVELKLEGDPDQRVRWLVGAYLYEAEDRSVPLNFFFGATRNFTGPVITRNNTTNTALFARISADVTEKIALDVEARSAEETKKAEEYGDATTAARPFGRVLYSDSASFDNFTPRVTLTYKPQGGTTLYAIYSTGVKPGGLNGLIGQLNNKNTYAQEESVNTEIGWKQSLFDGRASLTLAAYDTIAQDYQLTTPIVDITGASATGLTSIVTNQAKARIQGFEADIKARLGERFDVSANYAYTDPRFTSGCDDQQYTFTSGGLVMSAVANVPVAVPVFRAGNTLGLPAGAFQIPAGANCSIKGKQVPLTAEHQASVAFGYTQPTGWNETQFVANLDATYESTKYTQVHNQAETGETTLVGARVGLEGDRWSLTAFGRNLTNEDSITIATRWFDLFQGSAAGAGVTAANVTSGLAAIDTGSPRGFFYGVRRGRQIGVELKVKY